MKIYDKDFKKNTVQLCLTSDRSVKAIAEELGLCQSTLSRWVREYKHHENDCFPGKGHASPHEEEVRALRKELRHVRQERDILKKAVAIFSEPRGKDTSL